MKIYIEENWEKIRKEFIRHRLDGVFGKKKGNTNVRIIFVAGEGLGSQGAGEFHQFR